MVFFVVLGGPSWQVFSGSPKFAVVQVRSHIGNTETPTEEEKATTDCTDHTDVNYLGDSHPLSPRRLYSLCPVSR